MDDHNQLQYTKIKQAIEFLNKNFKDQPSLDVIAEHVHLSPFHFQKLFTNWAGVSPKKYLQFLTLDYAKEALRCSQASILEASIDTGLSSPSRLHDLFVNVEAMTPKEYKNGGESLMIDYSFAETPFGLIIVASTTKGICYLAFCANKLEGFNALSLIYPNAKYCESVNSMHKNAVSIFHDNWQKTNEVRLHLRGTEFQLKVWQALLNIPAGDLSSYGDVASAIGTEQSYRAVGTAIGRNPVAFIIPCHRVIQRTGKVGGYRWGTVRKQSMIAWDAAKTNQQFR